MTVVSIDKSRLEDYNRNNARKESKIRSEAWTRSGHPGGSGSAGIRSPFSPFVFRAYPTPTRPGVISPRERLTQRLTECTFFLVRPPGRQIHVRRDVVTCLSPTATYVARYQLWTRSRVKITLAYTTTPYRGSSGRVSRT